MSGCGSEFRFESCSQSVLDWYASGSSTGMGLGLDLGSLLDLDLGQSFNPDSSPHLSPGSGPDLSGSESWSEFGSMSGFISGLWSRS